MKQEKKSEIGGLIMQRHDIEKWASMNELLEYLDVSRESVLRWITHRNMPAHKVGRVWKFKFSEVDEWIRSGGADDRSEPKETQTEGQDNGEG
jgi:excisionase family DNA binding protein